MDSTDPILWVIARMASVITSYWLDANRQSRNDGENYQHELKTRQTELHRPRPLQGSLKISQQICRQQHGLGRLKFTQTKTSVALRKDNAVSILE
jgi:hypothetical protein